MNDVALLRTLTDTHPHVRLRDLSHPSGVEVPVEHLESLALRLRDDERFAFDLLLDHTAIDWIEQKRIELVYQLYSSSLGHSLMLFTTVSREHPVVPSLMKVWRIAEFQEREVYDFFGVLYQGHTDLRRLFLEDDWQGFPLRKDYQDDFMRERPQ